MAADIFVSYDRDDERLVRPLCKALERRWSVFWDRRIPTGKNWREYLQKEAFKARCVIVVWTPRSVESEYVKEEAGIARDRHVLFPVVLEHVDDDRIPFGTRDIQRADLIGWTPGKSSLNFVALLDDIRKLLGKSRRRAGAHGARGRRTVASEPERRDSTSTAGNALPLSAPRSAKRDREQRHGGLTWSNRSNGLATGA